MFDVIDGKKVVATCATLQAAAETLLEQLILNSPTVVSGDQVLIEVEWRYIPGDCYEPAGYRALTAEAKVALMCAEVMRRIRMDIGTAVREAKQELRGVRFQTTSATGLVDVQLAWDFWEGFEMSVHEAGTRHIVYSICLDDRLNPYWSRTPDAEPEVPTLDYFVAKAREFGIELPRDRVELIRARAQVEVDEKPYGHINGYHNRDKAAA